MQYLTQREERIELTLGKASHIGLCRCSNWFTSGGFLSGRPVAGKWDLREIWKWDLREIICSSREICEDIESVAEKGVANEAMCEEDLLEWDVISNLLFTASYVLHSISFNIIIDYADTIFFKLNL